MTFKGEMPLPQGFRFVEHRVRYMAMLNERIAVTELQEKDGSDAYPLTQLQPLAHFFQRDGGPVL